MIKKILVPVDGSGHARKAVELASDLAVRYEASVHLLHVVPDQKIPDELIQFARSEHMEESPSRAYLKVVGNRILDATKAEARKKGVKKIEAITLEGDPSETIVEFARSGDFDLIVLGSRGLGSMKGLFLGSVSSKVCHAADRTCVTVK